MVPPVTRRPASRPPAAGSTAAGVVVVGIVAARLVDRGRLGGQIERAAIVEREPALGIGQVNDREAAQRDLPVVAVNRGLTRADELLRRKIDADCANALPAAVESALAALTY